MVQLALRTLRVRTGGFFASFASLFLGATIVMTFASLLDTAFGDDVSSTDNETLVTMAGVVGGWGLIIVVFAVGSTLTLSVTQRRREMALLKSIGATPAQVRHMVVGEAALLAVIAALAAVVPAMAAGGLLFDLLQDSDQVAATVDHRFGPIAIATGFAVTFVGATLAARLAARRATKVQATEALIAAAVESPKLGWKRITGGIVFLGLGIQTGVITATVMKGEGSDAMQTSGQSSIWAGIGFALLAPALLRAAVRVAGGIVQRLGGASGHLAVQNLRQRSKQMGAALMPIILFVAIATGTIIMQSIENGAADAEGLVQTQEQRNIETLNFVVVGMIALFAAVMVVNTAIAATRHRRQELAQQRLAGATPRQVLRMVALESAVLVGVGALFGSIASLATIVPYSIARTDAPIPDTGLLTWLAVLAAATGLTTASTVLTARRTIHEPAIQSAAVAPA